MSSVRMELDGYEGPRHRYVCEEFSLHIGGTLAPTVCIRNYRPGDREAVRRICCDCAFLGDPVDVVYRDRELYADLMTGAYLDPEPEWALVVEDQGRVVGYLLASVNGHFNRALIRNGFTAARKMVGRLLNGEYGDHPRSEQFVRWMLTAGWRERPRHPAGTAHLHYNLERRYRGRSLGKRMWELYERMLRAEGVDCYYAEFLSCARRHPETAYSRFGFTVYDRRETTIFRPEIPGPVYVVCARKRIGRPALH